MIRTQMFLQGYMAKTAEEVYAAPKEKSFQRKVGTGLLNGVKKAGEEISNVFSPVMPTKGPAELSPDVAAGTNVEIKRRFGAPISQQRLIDEQKARQARLAATPK